MNSCTTSLPADSDLSLSRMSLEMPISIHVHLKPAHVVLLAMPVLMVWVMANIYRGYKAFIALGPGGTPQTPAGYFRICVLRLFTLSDVYEPPSTPPTLQPQTGYLSPLLFPKRKGDRPKVDGLAPHRQLTQKSPRAVYDLLCKEIEALVQNNSQRLTEATSCFEKHSTGIFAYPAKINRAQTCKGEICHAHPSDGSMHLTLHPADVKTLLERGWGERHPLARESWYWRVKVVPSTFVMVYGPRNEDEVPVVMEVVKAAAWWVAGQSGGRGLGAESTIHRRELGDVSMMNSGKVVVSRFGQGLQDAICSTTSDKITKH